MIRPISVDVLFLRNSSASVTGSVEFRALGLAMERKKFEPWRPWEGSAKLAENEKFVEPNNQQSVNEPLRPELPAEKRATGVHY